MAYASSVYILGLFELLVLHRCSFVLQFAYMYQNSPPNFYRKVWQNNEAYIIVGNYLIHYMSLLLEAKHATGIASWTICFFLWRSFAFLCLTVMYQRQSGTILGQSIFFLLSNLSYICSLQQIFMVHLNLKVGRIAFSVFLRQSRKVGYTHQPRRLW